MMVLGNHWKGTGKVTDLAANLACVTIKFPYNQPIEYYWVRDMGYKIGDDVAVSLIRTASGQWYQGRKVI
jgi:hypothetical protein